MSELQEEILRFREKAGELQDKLCREFGYESTEYHMIELVCTALDRLRASVAKAEKDPPAKDPPSS